MPTLRNGHKEKRRIVSVLCEVRKTIGKRVGPAKIASEGYLRYISPGRYPPWEPPAASAEHDEGLEGD